MTPRQLLFLAQADGVMVALTAAGRLKLSGDDLAIDRWLGTVGQYSSQIIAELSVQAESGPMDGDHLPAATDISPDAGQRTLEPGIGLTTKGIEQ
ncbi:MAG: hypothetical protein WCV99_04245 [Sterolibacterium sp.]